MTTTKHTAEPWQTFQSDAGGIVADDKGNTLASLPWAGDNHDPEANAARIVACVNACAGIDDPVKAINGAKAALKVMADMLVGSGSQQARNALRALGG